jgi:hypothetical protein
LTFRREISQEIARRRVGNLCVDQKEKLRSREAAHVHVAYSKRLEYAAHPNATEADLLIAARFPGSVRDF